MLFILKLLRHPLLLITIMKNVFLFLLLMIVLPVLLPADHTVAAQNRHASDAAIQVPLGGNTWVHGHTGNQRSLTGNGIEHWNQKEVSFTTYVRITRPGTIQVKLKSKANQPCKVAMTIAGQKKTIAINQSAFQWIQAGKWRLTDTGYIAIQLSAVEKQGERFADISDYELSGTTINGATTFVKNNEDNFFYWGRRGPSVHLSYPFADSIQAEWFYNEITVPAAQDVIGSYFMANGFREGYFGIQVNSATERRILFSVWSPFATDDPTKIPEDMRITMVKKGEQVYTGVFGNEGSGGQSYLRFPWKAGITYGFLLRGVPDNNNNTVYTAYFHDPEQDKWMLIASFKRPKTNVRLTGLHSFLENFNPDQGDKERKVLFSNQWICDVKGNWFELKKAGFTYDETAAKGYRKDYAGGVEGNCFFLKNCGFFNQYTLYKSTFVRIAGSNHPVVYFAMLP
jgi:hypothetical protein